MGYAVAERGARHHPPLLGPRATVRRGGGPPAAGLGPIQATLPQGRRADRVPADTGLPRNRASAQGDHGRGLRFTLPASLTGSPAVSVPAGSDAGGMPLAVQLIGRPWEDHRLLAAASVLTR